MTQDSRLANKPCSEGTKWETQKFLDTATSPAGETSYTSDLAENFRHGGWKPFRVRVDAAMASLPAISPRRLSAFRSCGCDAYVESRTVGDVHRHTDYRIRSTKCHDRFCVPCAAERSNRIRDSLLQHMHLRENMSLITLTLRASEDPLSKILDRITRCFRLLRNRPMWKKAVEGGCAIVETKVGADGKSWHVHFHVLTECKFISQQKLSDAWMACTGDSRIVDIRRVGAKSGAVQYITKYVTKAADHSIVTSPKHLTEAITAFTSRRLVSTFGTWRGLQLMEKPDEEILSISATEWTGEGRLDDFLRRAFAGEHEAVAIVSKLRGGRVRPPPIVSDLP